MSNCRCFFQEVEDVESGRGWAWSAWRGINNGDAIVDFFLDIGLSDELLVVDGSSTILLLLRTLLLLFVQSSLVFLGLGDTALVSVSRLSGSCSLSACNIQCVGDSRHLGSGLNSLDR